VTHIMHIRAIAAVAVLSTLAVSLEARDKRAHFDSAWLTTPITVDGSPTDWAGPLAFPPKWGWSHRAIALPTETSVRPN